MQNEYLVHYGVLGMKWGRRKSKPSSGSKKTGIIDSLKKKQVAKKKAKVAAEREKKRAAKNDAANKKPIKNMTDAELNKYVARLQKEKQARDLKYDRMSTGQKVINDIAKQSATRIGTTVAYQVGTYVIGKQVNKRFGDEVIKISSGKKKEKQKAA